LAQKGEEIAHARGGRSAAPPQPKNPEGTVSRRGAEGAEKKLMADLFPNLNLNLNRFLSRQIRD
jgi:hypothetical protein